MVRWEVQLPDGADPAAPGCAVIVLRGRLQAPDVAGLRLPLRLVHDEAAATCLVCDVAGLVWPDLGTVDALARLQVLAHRLGRRVVLRGASECLHGLIELMGLTAQLPSVDAEQADGSAGRAACPWTDEIRAKGGHDGPDAATFIEAARAGDASAGGAGADRLKHVVTRMDVAVPRDLTGVTARPRPCSGSVPRPPGRGP